MIPGTNIIGINTIIVNNKMTSLNKVGKDERMKRQRNSIKRRIRLHNLNMRVINNQEGIIKHIMSMRKNNLKSSEKD